MVVECLTWISHLWNKLFCSLNVRTAGFAMQNLPEEILIDILSRLPGDCVLECRSVCKQWWALTSRPNFVEMHLTRATPALFMQYYGITYYRLDMFIFDEGAKPNQMVKKMGVIDLGELDTPRIYGSCDGLLVFRSQFPGRVSIVCNPLTGEKITIRSPVDPVMVCGIFLHPVSKEYMMLFVHHPKLFVHMEGINFQYFLYSLRGQLWRKLNDFPYRPDATAPPTILNGALHWIVNPYWVNHNDIPPYESSIMMFNMETEEFRSMPCPGIKCPVGMIGGKNFRILDMEGKLSLCHVFDTFIFLSVLEDYEKWIWGEGQVISLSWHVNCCPFGVYGSFGSLALVDIQNKELLLDGNSEVLFRYNLRDTTMKEVGLVGKKQKPVLPLLDCPRLIIPYTKTFVSPFKVVFSDLNPAFEIFF